MQHVNSWRDVAAATGAADRAAAEEGVRRAYRTAGLAEPERIVWAESPRAAVEAVEKLPDAGRSVREEVRTRPWAEERRRMYDELGPAGWSALWSATGAQLWETTAALAERIRSGVVADLAPKRENESAVRLVLLDAVLGQHDAAWLAAFDGRGDRLTGLAEVARNAGWWWPYERAVVISERPEVLHRDEAGRLDHGARPALAYRDGFALYAWRGMPVPADFLAELASLTPRRIREEENAELRRVMLEFYGYDRYLTESGAEPVHRDETGILWRIALDGDEDVVMVEVVNSTPEADGTHRTYWLRVPPATRTAKDGVAWTFGLDGAAYAPVRQT
ncbi:DUF6745 domain-containing protein [Streptomyces cyaneofuscatus]|uniref:DUF6745 domain-containing protein n=1 Tax=Streptomyces cyaneofuscatus TaxID=66883 RepID=A0ABZ1F5C9_9ACTN|nr:hypothetical protein [Streptomyces cyaneofuscatus]WSB11604.1 hypothetical protein OG849_32250 [Streptomyces cyaneofuscatus]WSD44862.1 hypothetical protein OG857_03150 [Streptomyces cyaneofuscatus]